LNHGKNFVEIKAGELKPGVYVNSLYVDGKLAGKNKMVCLSEE
jgi:hypothetical protein